MKDISYMYNAFPYNFLREEDCKRYSENTVNSSVRENPLITFIMPVHNEFDEMNCTVNSLIDQEFKDWELIIWDNSDTTELPYRLASNLAAVDDRVRPVKSPFPMGFTKALSEAIFNYAKGNFCLYLGTGDLLVPGSLTYLSHVLIKEAPDVVFSLTCASYSEDGTNYFCNDIKANEYKIFDPNCSKTQAMLEIMKNTFYNSFTNVMKREFLLENGIDFWSDYRSDCAGMQYVIALAGKMIIFDEYYYISTISSSQTRGSYYIGSCYTFGRQWNAAKQVMIAEQYEKLDDYKYVSTRIINNLTGMIGPLAGGRWRDQYMEKAVINVNDIINEIEYLYTDPDLVEMMELCPVECQIKMVYALKELKSYLKEDDHEILKRSFSYPLILIGMCKDTMKTQEIVVALEEFIMEENNVPALGAEVYICIMNTCAKKANNEIKFRKYKEVTEKITGYLGGLSDDVLDRMIIQSRVTNMRGVFL